MKKGNDDLPFKIKEKRVAERNEGYSPYFEREFGDLLETMNPKPLSFDMFPRAIKKNIFVNLGIALLFLIVGLTIIISSGFSGWKILIIIALFFGYFVLNSIALFRIGYSKNYFTFEGIVTVAARHTINPLKKQQEYTIQITDFERNKTLAFDYIGENRPKEGMPATVYIIKGTKVISDSDYGPFIDNFLGVSFHLNTKEIADSFEENSELSIDDYVSKKK